MALVINKVVRCIFPLKTYEVTRKQKIMVTVVTVLCSLSSPLLTISGVMRGQFVVGFKPERGICSVYYVNDDKQIRYIKLALWIAFNALPNVIMVLGNVILIVFAGMKSTRRVSWKRVAMVVLVTLFNFISYTPLSAMEMVLSKEPGTVPSPRHSMPHFIAMLCWLFSAQACWLNVFIYLITNRQFRRFTAKSFRLKQNRSNKVTPRNPSYCRHF